MTSTTTGGVHAPGSIMLPGMACVATVIFDPLATALSKHGITGFEPLNLPSIDPKTEPLPTGLEADIAAIRAHLVEQVEIQGRDIYILCHSLGGAPGLSATVGLWKSTRERQGKKGGIVRALCIGAAMSLPGESRAAAFAEYVQQHGGKLDYPEADVEQTPQVLSNPLPTYLLHFFFFSPPAGHLLLLLHYSPFPLHTEQHKQGMLLKPTGCGPVFFNDLGSDLHEKWEATLASTALTDLTTPAPDNVDPSEWDIAFLQGRLDRAMTVEYDEYAAQRVRERGGKVEIQYLDEAAHFPWLREDGTREEVVRWMGRVMGAEV